MPAAPKVFISYSHDSPEHSDRVLDLADRLREGGIDAEIDQYETSPAEGWPAWCARQIKSAGFVLLVCTETYLRRVDGEEAPGIGHGVRWETRIMHQLLYDDAGSVSAKFIPVLFSDGSPGHIPTAVKGAAHFVVDDEKEYERLYRLLTAQPRVLKPVLGKPKTLPPKERKSSGGASTPSPPLADFATFRDIDAPWCPEMVVIPAGEFLMGSPSDEPERKDSEGPLHKVTIGQRFAIGRCAMTFEEYDHFCEVTWREKPPDRGWGRDRQPAINVSWRDAMAYVEWLAAETDQRYRVPSEAEWEYVCRAGTPTPFSFGWTITPNQVNYDGNDYAGGAKGFYREKTVPVGSLPANPWKLHEMHGNVWEWVEDVWHDSYSGAPVDGSAWTDGEGLKSFRNRVVRGGSWGNLRYCRSAYRYIMPGIRNEFLGFRVARTLS